MRKIFRQAALDRLSSPEQLDELLQVTAPRTWIALATVVALLVAGVVWGVVGSIPERVSGRGILLRGGGVLEVATQQGGRLKDLAVEVGDDVEAGQVIARVYLPEQEDRLRRARADHETQRQEFERVARYNGENQRLQEASLEQQVGNLRQSIATSEQDLRTMEEKVAAQEQLVAKGLVTRQTLITTRQTYDGVKQKIREAQQQITRNQADLIRTRTDAGKSLDGARAKLAEATRALTTVEREVKEATEVVSPYTGRILEVLATQGSFVQSGAAVATLDMHGSTTQGLEAVIYVKSSDGKKIRPGMQVLIAPSTVRQEEYGFLVGTITYVSDLPATPRGMSSTLKNDKLVASLAGNDAPYQVHADLAPDPSTPSRYRWTSAKGPPLRIGSGTLCGGDILIRSRRPLEMVVPLLRSEVGL